MRKKLPLLLLGLLLVGPLPLTAQSARIQEEIVRISSTFSNGRVREALSLVDALLRRNPYSREGLLWKGVCLEALGDDARAQTIWQEGLRQDPAYLPILTRFGALHLRRKEPNKAMEYFRKILTREPLDITARLGMAEAFLQKKMLTDAQKELDEAVRLAPRSGRGHFLLGELALARQERSKARNHFLKAKEYDPEYPAVYERLARMMEEEADTDTAGLYLDRATALDPANLATYSSLASFHMRNRQWEQAWKVFDKVRTRFPDDPVFHYNLAVLADRMKRQTEALREVETALRLDSEDPYAALFYFFRLRDSNERTRQKILAEKIFRKARDFAKNGNHPEAVVNFRKGLMLSPEEPGPRYDYSLSLRRLASERAYLRELAIAVELDPEKETWAFQLERDRRRYDMKMKDLARIEPPRTETRVLVLPFSQPASAEFHLDAGILLAQELVLHLNNHARLLAVLSTGDEQTWAEEARRYDMVVRGSFRETPKSLRLEAELLTARDLQPVEGPYVEAFNDNGRAEAAVRNLTRKLAARIPYRGKIFRIDDRKILVNLGSEHAVAKNSSLVVYRPGPADAFNPTEENFLGSLKIIDLQDEFLVAEATDRNLYRKIRLEDSVGPAPPPPAPAPQGRKRR